MNQATVKTHRAPVSEATPIISYSPVVFNVPGRIAALEMRVVMPAVGTNLPVILFSHGHGASNFLASMRGYGPLVDFYAQCGFVVIIPTHQNSKTLALDANGPEGILFWRSRAQDMKFILDHLDQVEATVPGLAGRMDTSRVAAVGHSLGAHTVCMLAGMRVHDPVADEVVDLSNARVKTAVMISPPGARPGASEWLKEHYPVLVGSDFSTMKLQSLIVGGTEDNNPNFSVQPEWRADAFKLSPGPKSLLIMNGAEHMFGGISGYDAKETSDENPQRVADLQRITWAYLRSTLYADDKAWETVMPEIAEGAHPIGRIETKY